MVVDTKKAVAVAAIATALAAYLVWPEGLDFVCRFELDDTELLIEEHHSNG